MIKNIIAIISLIALSTILIYQNFWPEEDKQDGAMIVSPEVAFLQKGDQVNNFELKLFENQEKVYTFNTERNKPIFINFWASWCKPCRDEMPALEKFSNQYKEELEVITINVTETESKLSDVQAFLDEGSYTFPVLLDENSDVTNAFSVITIPTSFLIDENGILMEDTIKGALTLDEMTEMWERNK